MALFSGSEYDPPNFSPESEATDPRLFATTVGGSDVILNSRRADSGPHDPDGSIVFAVHS
jgi:hypothetical protein